MKYHSVTVTRRGPPSVLQVVEHELRDPAAPSEVRIKVLATPVCGPDVQNRYGQTPNGRRVKLYGTTASRFNRRRLLADWATLFQWLAEGAISPVIMQKFPILAAAKANELLESGAVVGNLVLVAPELL